MFIRTFLLFISLEIISTNFTNAVFDKEYGLKFLLKLVVPPPETILLINFFYLLYMNKFF